MLTEAEY